MSTTPTDAELVAIYDEHFDAALFEGRKPLAQATASAVRAVYERGVADARPRVLDPDCRDGKHTACPGWTWDDDEDRPRDCECACHEGK